MEEGEPWFLEEDICALSGVPIPLNTLGLSDERWWPTSIPTRDGSRKNIALDFLGVHWTLKAQAEWAVAFAVFDWIYDEVKPAVRVAQKTARKAAQKVTEIVEQKSLQVTGIDSAHLNFDFGGQDVRVVMKDGAPLFAAKDICDALELGNSRQATSRLREDEKDDVILNDAIGRKQMNSVVSEAGLYKLIMKSRKATAEKFVDWVSHEVLPTIRKTGAYMTDATMDKIEQDPEYMSKVLDEIKTLKLERDEARAKGNRINDKRTATSMGRLGAAKKKIYRLEEKIEYMENDTLATEAMSVGEIDWIFKYFENNRAQSMSRIIGSELTRLSRERRYPICKSRYGKNNGKRVTKGLNDRLYEDKKSYVG